METYLKLLQPIIAFGSGISLLVFLWLLPPLPNIENLLVSVIVYGALLEEVLKVATGLVMVRGFHFKPFNIILVGLGFGLAEQMLHIIHNDPFVYATLLMHIASCTFAFWLLIRCRHLSWFWIVSAAISVHATYNIVLWLYLYLLS